jgi:hypothetical protein
LSFGICSNAFIGRKQQKERIKRRMTGAKLVTSKKKEKAKKTLHPEGPSSRSRRGTGDIPSSSRDVPRGHNYVKVKIVVY